MSTVQALLYQWLSFHQVGMNVLTRHLSPGLHVDGGEQFRLQGFRRPLLTPRLDPDVMSLQLIDRHIRSYRMISLSLDGRPRHAHLPTLRSGRLVPVKPLPVPLPPSPFEPSRSESTRGSALLARLEL